MLNPIIAILSTCIVAIYFPYKLYQLVTMAWLANTDVSPCTSSQAVLNYIRKYYIKAKTKTTSYTNLV